MSDVWLIVIAAIGAFAAGYIDAVVGGGGLLQVPLLFLLFPEFPHTTIISSNRLASCVGTGVAAYHYNKANKVNYKLLIVGMCTAIVASYSGAYIMPMIDTAVFKPILFFIIAALVLYTVFKKNMGNKQKVKFEIPKLYFIMALVCIIIGLYNGVFGPGTGTLLLVSLVQIIGFSFLNASGYAKIINATADVGSLISFVIQGAVWYPLAIPMLIMNVAGSYIGTKMAIKKGNDFIRKLFLFIMSVLLLRLGYELLYN
jgi:uncharacterized protein